MFQDENKVLLLDVGDTTFVSVKPAENPLRLVLLDTGISVSLSKRDLDNLKAVFTAVVLGEVLLETPAKLKVHCIEFVFFFSQNSLNIPG